MKLYLAFAIACLFLQVVPAANAQPPKQPRSSHAAIEKLLTSYERSLNASDVDRVARLYTDDAVLLAPGAPPAVGIDAVRAAYAGLFGAIDIDLTFKIAEVNVVSPDWAFLRSTSRGVATSLANGAQIPSSNQELFVLHQHRGSGWKIARYSFSSVLPSS
jgi:uncharacterized protein (TIGR02246 family)